MSAVTNPVDRELSRKDRPKHVGQLAIGGPIGDDRVAWE
jgi:hypothetical protein